MPYPTALNPTHGKAASEVNSIPFSARISKPSLSDASDHTQAYKHSVTRRRKRGPGKRWPGKASPDRRVGIRSEVPQLGLYTPIANQYLSRRSPILMSPTSIERYLKNSSPIFQTRKGSARGSTTGEPPLRRPPRSMVDIQNSGMRSLSGQVKDQTRRGPYSEQWEARMMLATEIGWREDKELLEKGLSMELLLEMKVKQRGSASDVLIFAQHVLGHAMCTRSFKEHIQVMVRFAGTTVGWEAEQHRSVPLDVLLTPSSPGGDSTSFPGDRSSISTGQDLLCTLLTPSSNSPMRPCATSSAQPISIW